MKVLINLMKLELLNVIRGKFHWVLLITIAAIIGTYYLLPPEPRGSGLADSAAVSIERIEPAPGEPVRDGLIPAMLAFEVAILGYLFIAVTMFQEKEEGAVRAYRVSPGTTLAYTLSKISVWVLISLIYAGVLAAATVTAGFSYSQMFGIVFAVSLLLTSLGLIIAVFFNSMSDWFVPGVAVLVLNMLPAISLSAGGFNPLWLKIIPGYHAVKAFDELFSAGRIDNFAPLFAALLLAAAALFSLGSLAVHLKLMREGR